MGVMTINTATRTRLICAKQPVRLGLSALLLVGSVGVHTRIRSAGTKGRLVWIASPPSLRRRGISRALLCKYLPWGGAVGAGAGVEEAREEEAHMPEELVHQAMDKGKG